MPVNVTTGNPATFVAEFFDADGARTAPAGATLDITYITGTTTASTSIAMTQTNSFFTATWQSSVADLGLAPWTVTATGESTAAASGELRIIS